MTEVNLVQSNTTQRCRSETEKFILEDLVQCCYNFENITPLETRNLIIYAFFKA